MSGEVEHGKRFARDLCSIRRARSVSLTDIHEATRMAYDLIKRFEHDALIDHPQFNQVYIRLFVREYATRIGIDGTKALEALELAIQGKYDGSLVWEYLDKSGEEKSSSEKEAPASNDAKRTAPEAAPEPPGEDASEESDEPAVMALPPEVPPKPPPEAPVASAPSFKGAPSRAPSGRIPARDSSSAGRKAFSQPVGKLDARWIFVGLLVIVIGLVIWNLSRAMFGADEAAQVPSPAAQTASDPATTGANEAFGLPLPDTLAITIVADKGSAGPIRVTLDDDIRRPYWIERGDAQTFRMADRMLLEQQLDSVTVHVEGVAYPLSRPAGQDSALLERTALASWFSSLSR